MLEVLACKRWTVTIAKRSRSVGFGCECDDTGHARIEMVRERLDWCRLAGAFTARRQHHHLRPASRFPGAGLQELALSLAFYARRPDGAFLLLVGIDATGQTIAPSPPHPCRNFRCVQFALYRSGSRFPHRRQKHHTRCFSAKLNSSPAQALPLADHESLCPSSLVNSVMPLAILTSHSGVLTRVNPLQKTNNSTAPETLRFSDLAAWIH